MIWLLWWALWTPYVGEGALSFLCIFAPCLAYTVDRISLSPKKKKKDLNSISKIDKGREWRCEWLNIKQTACCKHWFLSVFWVFWITGCVEFQLTTSLMIDLKQIIVHTCLCQYRYNKRVCLWFCHHHLALDMTCYNWQGQHVVEPHSSGTPAPTPESESPETAKQPHSAEQSWYSVSASRQAPAHGISSKAASFLRTNSSQD